MSPNQIGEDHRPEAGRDNNSPLLTSAQEVIDDVPTELPLPEMQIGFDPLQSAQHVHIAMDAPAVQNCTD